MDPGRDLPANPALSYTVGDSLSPEEHDMDPVKEKSYGDLLRSMSLSFGQILKKMKESANEPGSDSSDGNTVNDILQRCMLQGVEMLKDLSPENSSVEAPCLETDLPDIAPDGELTPGDLQRKRPVIKDYVSEYGLAGKGPVPENRRAGNEPVPENRLAGNDPPSDRFTAGQPVSHSPFMPPYFQPPVRVLRRQ